MSKTEDYRARLRTIENWEACLLQETGLPSPRGDMVVCMSQMNLSARTMADLAGSERIHCFAPHALCGCAPIQAEGVVEEMPQYPHVKEGVQPLRWNLTLNCA